MMAIGWLLGPLAIVMGPAPDRPGQTATTQSAVAEDALAASYVDGTYGFSIRPPRGWDLDRQLARESRGVRLLRMVNAVSQNRTEEMRLNRIAGEKQPAAAMEETLQRTARSLELEYSRVDILSQQVQEVAGRAGGVVTALIWTEGFEHLRLVGIVQAEPGIQIVLTYDGPSELRQSREALFQLVLGSLKLLVDASSEGKFEEALQEGAAWLSGLNRAAMERAIGPDEFFEIRLEDEPIGAVRVERADYAWKKRPGVRVRERGWTFEPDGRICRSQTTLFVGFDLRSERWKTSVTTLIPAKGDLPERLENAWEEGLRDGDVLLSSQAYQLGQPPTENPPLRLPPTYAPRAVVRVLPRLLDDLDTKRTIGFMVFDHQRAGLVLRTVTLKGPSQLPVGASVEGKVFRIEEREGVSTEPSDVYVDDKGRVLRIKTGKLTLVPIEAKDLEVRFGKRVAETEEKMTRLEEQYQATQERFRATRP